MATKYEEELEKAKLQPEQPQQQKQNALQGMSETTQQKLATLSQGYTPSQNVTSAQQYLQGIIGNKPGQYNSQYAPQITQLYDKMMNRGQFKYDMNADPLYQQYKNSYMNAGKQAMQDTIGNMSALTGGYGNSYAGAAGQQQYQQYLQGLHDVIPTLQQQAYDRYQQEGKDLQNLLAITQGLDETAYGRHRDTVGDWQADRGFAQGAYESAYDREYQDYLNQLNYWQQQGQMENQDYWTGKEYGLTKEQADRNWQMAQNEFDLNKTQAERDWEQAQLQMKLAQGEFGIAERSAAFDQAIAMMQMGMTPNAELLAMAGLTEADMEAYLALLRGNKTGSNGTDDKNKSGGFWDDLGDFLKYEVPLGMYQAKENMLQSIKDGAEGTISGIKDWMQNYYDPNKANQGEFANLDIEAKNKETLDMLAGKGKIGNLRLNKTVPKDEEDEYEEEYASILKELGM